MSGYTGTDNLEVMAEAVNYNAYLGRRVAQLAQADDRILDFGAGIGTFALQLQQRGYRVLCLEPDGEQAKLLREQGLAVCQRLDGVEDASLDYVYSLNVLEHIEDDRAALRGLHGKLKPGGRIFIYVPAFNLLYSSMDRKVGHVRRYRRGELVGKLEASGFLDVRARYVDSLGFFAALAFRALGNDSGDVDRRALRAYDRFAFPASLLCDRALGLLLGKNIAVTARRD